VATIEIDEASATQPHPAAPGDRVVIRVAESPTSGFRWQVDDFNPAALEAAGDDYLPADDAKTGGGGTREFHFVVRSGDRSDVALSLRRSWETDKAAAQHFHTSIN
jgi:inhibitor of cysteine peptidase